MRTWTYVHAVQDREAAGLGRADGLFSAVRQGKEENPWQE